MSDVSQRIAALSPEKRLLLGLLRQEKEAVPEPPRRQSRPFDLIPESDRRKIPAGVEDAYPLARMQAGMLFHMELTPESPLYHNVDSWHLRARFDGAAFQTAVQRAVACHAVMRTAFDLTGYSEPLQLVYAAAELPIRVEDIRHLSPIDQENLLDCFVAAEKTARFDLLCAPLLRFAVHLRSADTFQLTLTENHAVWDGWSLHSTLAEIFAAYFALLAKVPPPAEPPLTCSFRDYVLLEREALESEECRQFWARQLDGLPMVELPRWRGAMQETGEVRSRILTVLFSPELTQQLRRLGRSVSAPYKSVLLAAHLKVMALVSGRADVATGVVWNGRPEEEGGDRLRGLFLNVLPFRLTLGLETWAELVRRVFAAETEILPFRRYPVSELQRQRNGQPLFETAFNYIQFHVVDSVLASGELEVLGFKKSEGTNYALMAHFDQSGLQLEYDETRLPGGRAHWLSGLYERVLRAMSSCGSGSHETECLLSESERHQLLWEWNDTEAAPRQVGTGRCLHELFAGQAARTPGAVALEQGESRVSYRELEVRANALAGRLALLGIGAESRLGVSLQRTPEMVVALLGVLKCGGAYVPLDPSYPAERLRFLLTDAGVEVLLTQESLLPVLSPALPESVRVVFLEGGWEDSAAAPVVAVDLENLAYVIYTSGSTGRPKGVAITHRGACALLSWASGVFGGEELSGVFASTSINFDLSVFELFVPLTQGGRVVLGRDALDLSSGLEVSLVNTVPSALSELLRLDLLPERLRTVGLAGEPLKRSLVERIYERDGIERVYNLYGPSEDTTYSTVARIDRGEAGEPTIGRPVTGTRAYVLAPWGQPLPLGVAGELHLGGEGLARGYLGRPDLTAERFVPAPWGPAGGRLYRTGDLVRYRADGNLEFLGRLDHQVKIRGFRIELGEIESVLSQQSGVRESVVVAGEDALGERRLVAYVEAGVEVEEARLREALRSRLPGYMVPSVLVIVESLPRTPNGKLDRRSLPEPERGRAEPRSYVAPRDATEDLLAGLWAEVLGVERVGAEDDFFALGGHSLVATRLVSRVRDTFRIELPLRSLFDAPRLSDLASVVRSVLAAGQGTVAPPIERTPRDRPLPLSFAQQRLWFLDQLEPDNPAYNIFSAFGLRGALRVSALAKSLDEMVRRHESLRTTFPTAGGRAMQIVGPAVPQNLPCIDLGSLPAEARGVELERLAAAEARRPFQLARGPLLRTALLRLGAGEDALLCTLYHIISDGWSMGVLIRETAMLYAEFAAGRPSPLPELPIQYVDYAVWQREWLQGEVLAAELSHWRQRLAGAPALLSLPTDRPRPPLRRFRGAQCSSELPERLGAALRTLGRQHGATLFMVLLAILQTLLFRLTGEEDVIIGTPVAGRDRLETEGLIGFFANTLVLRGNPSREGRFSELLAQARETVLEAQVHQHLPFEKLVDELQPERSLSHTPLFQVMLVLQSFVQGRVETPDLELVRLGDWDTGAKFDLTLSFAEEAQGLSAGLSYDADLFDRVSMERMQRHLLSLAQAVVEAPEALLSDLTLLDRAERAQLLWEWNDTRCEYPPEPLLDRLFTAQAERAPERVALRFEGRELDYGELNRRADLLARNLHALGVGPDHRVGVCMERSFEMMVALLAILRAGAAYVPLDPSYPAERLTFMRRDAAVSVLLTQEALRARLDDGGPERLVAVDSGWDEITRSGAERPESAVGPQNVAYVIYTSGSTGKPKGVMVPHSGILNRLLWMQDRYGLTADDRVLQKTPLSFDVSVWELFWPLIVGARLVLARPEGHRDPAYLADLITGEGITTLHFVPSMLQVFLEEPGVEKCGSLRRVICSGEALPAELAERFSARLGAELHNLYGPTEASVDVTSWACLRGVALARVPIGRPIANIRIHLLDAALEPVPVGVSGELMIGGVGLARGYLGRPALTAERFIPDPFIQEPGQAGERLYRTGDLARWLPQGELEFLGRFDHQVKVRGFRIELGEIEAALTAHSAVRESVVLARRHGAGETHLVAYLVPEAGAAVSIPELRDVLREHLPDYMVPAAFVVLEALPITPNGKLDRKALPAPDATRREVAVAYVPPRNPREAALAAIWAEVLHLERVGIHDRFFDLGGDSILSIQVVSRATESGLRLTPRQLFQFQTIAELAEVAEAGAVATEEAPVAGPVPLTPIQQWFFEQDLPEPQHFNQAVLVALRSSPRPPVMARAVARLMEHHDAFGLRFECTEEGWRQRFAPDEALPGFACIDMSSLPESAHRPAIESAAAALQTSLDLPRGPLLRVVLFELGAAPARLLVLAHHLVIDGVSWRIILEDLGSACLQLERGEPVRLPTTSSFRRWAERLALHARSSAVRAELSYWTAEPRIRLRRLPVDHAEGRNSVAAAASLSVSLDAETTSALLHDVPRAYRTQINDALLTALVHAFARWSGENQLLVDLEGHGREEIAGDLDVSRTVGWFTTLFPVLLKLPRAADPGAALIAVKEQLRAVPQRGLGHGLLRYAEAGSEPDARLISLRSQPAAEVVFNYLGQIDRGVSEALRFAPAEESVGPVRSPRGKRAHLLEVQGGVSGGILQLDWIYASEVYERATIEHLAGWYLDALRSLIGHCLSPEAGGYAPSDFPEAALNQKDLNKVLARVGSKRARGRV